MPEIAVLRDIQTEIQKHKNAIPIDHPDLSVTRTKLEYPTVDVFLIYLASINKIIYVDVSDRYSAVVTYDSFADKMIEDIASVTESRRPALYGRFRDKSNSYYVSYNNGASTADFELCKIVAGGVTRLGYEAVDLTAGYTYLTSLSISGSALKAYRAGTLKISVTDTSFASGRWGMSPAPGADDVYDTGMTTGFAMLKAPTSAIQPSIKILEVPVRGNGTMEDPYMPDIPSELVNVLELDKSIIMSLPEHIIRDAKKYTILKQKGFSDEEIELVFGRIQIEIDLLSVTWGSFEFSYKSATNIIMITGDNPYKPGAIQKQIDFAKSNGLKTFSAPKTYNEAISLYNQLNKYFSHWLAGKDNFAYHVLGYEELEPLAVIDFYYGELIEHKTHYDQIKNVPDWEMRNTLEIWNKRLEKAKPNLPVDEYDKHRGKLGKILKLGW